MSKLLVALAAATLIAAPANIRAAELPFTGSVTGSSTLIGADPSCAPLQFRSQINPASTIGVSSLGAFTYSTNTCLSLGGLLSNGSFIINFGTDQFNGTFDGGSTPSAVAGVSNTSWLFTILGGTGRFDGATGSFTGIGTTDARTRPSLVAITFNGLINAPAVPEPASWVLMLTGFGLIAAQVRRRRAHPAAV